MKPFHFIHFLISNFVIYLFIIFIFIPLSMTYWVVAVSLMLVSVTLGMVKRCKCYVSDFAEQYGSSVASADFARTSAAKSSVLNNQTPKGLESGLHRHRLSAGQASRTPTMSTLLTNATNDKSPLTLR